MKKRTCLFLMMCLVVMSTAWAESISETQARNIADNFMASHHKPNSRLTIAHKGPSLKAPVSNERAAYYVFNDTQARNGYVIVAGDDRVPAVLGYSDDGTFDSHQVPEAMQALLDSYAEQIEALDNGGEAAPLLAVGRTVRPLLTSNWSQKSPFNMLLPFVNGNRAVTGCVATAAAQVLYYWKWPARPTTPIPAYTSESFSIYMPELPVVDFNWDAMQDNYLTGDTTSAAGLAAATLSLYCAQSVEMDFNDGSSGATTMSLPLFLSSYFGYKASAHAMFRNNYTSEEWANAIYNELAAGRPVIYSGSKASSGHAFVCDGYDGNGMFHFNWGWNGQSNGYFVLNVLNPDLQGTGSATGAYGYIYRQAIIVGLEPGNGENTFAFTSALLTIDSSTTTRSSVSSDFKAVVTGRFYNYTAQVMAVDYGWALYQGDNLVKILYQTYSSSIRPGYSVSPKSKELSFGKNISSGTYRILPIYSERYASNWRPCIGADVNYIDVVINNNQCTLTGYGSASTPDYQVNSITTSGTCNTGRPVNIDLSLTNQGVPGNHLLYMFVDGEFSATGYVSIAPGETAVIPYRYMTTTAGNRTLTFSFNDDGSDPIATYPLTITAMPAANLSGSIKVLNVTDTDNKIVTSDQFSVEVTVTNNGSSTYNEDISVKLYKDVSGSTGTTVQSRNTLISLAPGATTTLRFDFDNVINGWRYFANAYYYNAGTQTKIKGTSFHTIIFPEVPDPEPILGDVNGDGEMTVTDVILYINYLLNDEADGFLLENADFNIDSISNITDVIDMINYLLNN